MIGLSGNASRDFRTLFAYARSPFCAIPLKPYLFAVIVCGLKDAISPDTICMNFPVFWENKKNISKWCLLNILSICCHKNCENIPFKVI